ncbi:uncharacterized protein LOC125727403 [Brienomyrus brachyistius]|uniref:uncharacterized protein LOC125727403 n=1 Tax=Brienomyrus brachyistius TaxID=42636 RepID=UPI0020B31C2E|nr:uncharacterized protein LOC125727403 [Brienomyrus brachyistius]
MLGTLEEENKVRWRDYVQPLVHAYNCTKNDTTGFSPYQLMFGRQPSLPIDVPRYPIGLNPERQSRVTHTDFVKRLKERLRESYKLAVEHSDRTAQKNKERYDLKVRETILDEGDRVLVKNVGVRGKHKIADRWSRTVYRIVKRINDSPVYVITPVNADGPIRTLHRDLLLPCGFLTSSTEAEVAQPKQKRETVKPAQSSTPEGNEEHPRESEEDDYYCPGDVWKEMTFPTVTVVHEIPQTYATSSSRGQWTTLSHGDSRLSPEAEVFQPSRDWQLECREGEVPNSSGRKPEGGGVPSVRGFTRQDELWSRG